jgi:hypothetical protein
MRAINAGDAGFISLSDLVFTAKIDYLTVFTPGKLTLPRLDGKPKWSRKEHYRRLSIHDPSARDVAALVERLDNPRLAELEVAVDLQPAPRVSVDKRERVVEQLMVHLIAKSRAPKVTDKDLQFRFRGVYEGRRGGFRLHPFNRKLPLASGQQLHGKRGDPLQAKAYAKKTDMGRALDRSAFLARTEIRMSGYGLAHHGLDAVGDLAEFRFRKMLMPYFRFVKAAKRRAKGSPRNRLLRDVLTPKQEKFYRDEWERVGVGAFLPGGKYGDHDVRLISFTKVNTRVGQALLRLEQRMKFVHRGRNP